MKTIRLLPVLLGLLTLAPAAFAQGDPRITSWLTTYSGQYARIFTTDANRLAGTFQTTWTNGSIIQALPTYCGVSEVVYAPTNVYIRSTGLGGHVMGAWQNGSFPNYPKNQGVIARIPRLPSFPAGARTATGGGPIGYFVDGVAMFDSRDAFAYTSSSGSPGTEANPGSGYWNRDAWVNESATFDPAQAHQPGSGQYHYHANPPALRYLLGDHVLYNSATKTYSEDVANTNLHHSPILGWVRDGFPVYGPYGYSVATNAASGVRRMISGFQLRSTSATGVTNRTTYPLWAVRVKSLASTNLTTEAGPNVSAQRPLGRYLEDNDYLGDLINPGTGSNYVQGTDFDLNEWNARYCYTPEFPGGTYAYFVCINAAGTPVFPYNIGRQYYGTPAANVAGGTYPEAVTTNFNGGTRTALAAIAPTVNATNANVTLTWTALDGGTYVVEATADFSSWTPITTNSTYPQATNFPTPQPTRSLIETNAAQAGVTGRYYRVRLTATNSYDSTGFAP
ncbi:MAG: YHYH protein [Verrucomicrobia bacterium]|nr:YHYH protein [Verrucomicrobiota bacterium]